MKEKILQKNPELAQAERILVAVSTGVDSMVLLRLLEQLPKKKLGVAHIDHRLRPESAAESAFLRAYCQEHQLPFYVNVWETTAKTGIEAKARAFRYAFFQEIMAKEGYSLLVTAHHGDDQMETMLMRLVRGTSFGAHAGIQRTQPFGQGKLVRPLLDVSKEEIYRYAQAEQVPFFEDATNRSLHYTRNRIRQQIVPQLKQENPRALAHFGEFHAQLNWAQEIIKESLRKSLERIVFDAQGWRFSKEVLPDSKAKRYYFLSLLFEESRARSHVEISQRQLFALLELLENGASQWRLDLGKGWQFRRSYEQFFFQQVPVISEESHQLQVAESLALSSHETLRLLPIEKATAASDFRVALPATIALPLTIRRRRPGDKIRLSPRVQKKVSRYFIDEKIPQPARESAWIVESADQEVLAVVPFVHSYLSIEDETDRIYYMLDYVKQAQN